MDPDILTAEIRDAEATYFDDIEAIELAANALSGDLTIGEIVALLIRRGWKPPQSPAQSE